MPIVITRKDGSTIRLEPDFYHVEVKDGHSWVPGMAEELKTGLGPGWQDTARWVAAIGLDVRPIYPPIPPEVWH